ASASASGIGRRLREGEAPSRGIQRLAPPAPQHAMRREDGRRRAELWDPTLAPESDPAPPPESDPAPPPESGSRRVRSSGGGIGHGLRGRLIRAALAPREQASRAIAAEGRSARERHRAAVLAGAR